MPRKITDHESKLVMKLVGDEFPDLIVLRYQLKTCRVIDLSGNRGLEFEIVSPQRFMVPEKTLGEGCFYDADGVPIILTLLQRKGCLWHLDVYRADNRPMKTSVDQNKVKSLGYGQGLTLEY